MDTNPDLAALALEMAEQEERDVGKPGLRVDKGNLPATAEGLRDLLAGRPALFDRGAPVRLVHDALRQGLVADLLTVEGVVREAHAAARPFEVSEKEGGWLRQSRKTLPDRVAKLYLDMKGEWRLRPLDGITTAPLMADDGGIRCAEGYDPATRLWCERVPAVLVPDEPTRAEAQAALWRVREAFRTFAFADAERVPVPGCPVPVVDLDRPPGRDKSALLHALLCAVCRPSLPKAPALMVRSPQLSGAGTGKGLLVRAVYRTRLLGQ